MKTVSYPVVLKVLLPLIAGILVSHFSNIEIGFPILLGLFAILLLLFILREKSRIFSETIFSLILFAFFVGTGIYLDTRTDSSKKQNYFSNYANKNEPNYFHLRINEPPEISQKWIKCEASVVALNDSLTTGFVQIFIEHDSLAEKIRYGDQIYASGFLTPLPAPSNPHEFDYRSYMKLHDIHHQIFLSRNQWRLVGNKANPFLEKVYAVRNYCSGVFENSGMAPENIAVAKALVLGDKTLISDETMLSFASTGALHVLAVSGLHVGIVMLILGFLLKPLKRLRNGKYFFLIAALSGIWFFAVLTGLSPSVLRAAVMFSFVMIGNEIQRETSIYQSLMISAVILILTDPNIIFKLGFLLSYLAVTGIIFFHPKIYSLLFFKNKIADKIWQITCVSIAAQIATLPLGIYCFQQFPNYFLIANLLVIPLAFLILITGIFSLTVSTIPIISTLVFFILDWLIYILNHGVRFVENLPFAVTDSILINWYDSVILYLFIAGISFSLVKRSKKMIHFSMLFLVIFFTSQFLDRYEQKEIKKVVFYKISDYIVADLFTGNKYRTISTLDLNTKNSDLDFHVIPNRVHLSGKKTTNENFSINDSSGIFSFENKTLFFADQKQLDSIYSLKIPKTDAIYLYNCNYLSNQLIAELVKNEIFVILGHGCTFRLKKYLADSVSKSNLYDISKSGALVLNF